MSFDVDTIAAQVKATLSALSHNPSGNASGIYFFNIKNDVLQAEIHIRNGNLVYLGVHSTTELKRQREAQEFVSRNRGD